MLKGFRDFIMRGNVIDLAVAVVIGAAFGNIVTALVNDLIQPLISATVGQPDFKAFFAIIHGGKFMYGDFITAVIDFLLKAAAIYFFVVIPFNTVMKRLRREEPAAAVTTKTCPECLSDVPLAARRCSHCAQPLAA